MLNIAVFVSGGGTNLQAIIDAKEAGRIKNGRLSCVLASRPGIRAIERAEKAGVPVEVLVRKEFDGQNAYDDALIALMKQYQIDLIVLAGFMTIISDKVIDAFRNRIINVHPSLIPSFCGAGYYGLKVHEEALRKGVKVSGATIHFVNEICDGGPIILQKAVAVEDDDTPEVLQKRIMQEAEWKLLPQAIELFCDNRLEVKDDKVRVLS